MPPRAPKIHETHIDQSFLDERYRPFPVRVVPEGRLDDAYFDWLLKNDEEETRAQAGVTLENGRSFGMHPGYTKSGHLAALAICIHRKVLVVTEIVKTRPTQPRRRLLLHSEVLSASCGSRVYAFNAHELVLALYRDMALTVDRAIDLLSLPPNNRDVVQTVKRLAGARLELFESAIRDAFQTVIYKNDKSGSSTLAQQAWFAWYIGTLPEAQGAVRTIPEIDSSKFTAMELDMLAQNVEGLLVRDLEKPSEETLDVSAASFTFRGNNASWKQQAYGKRIKPSPGQVIKAELSQNIMLPSTIAKVQGQQASLRVQHLDHVNEPNIRSLTIVGRAAPTKAEQKHTLAILNVLQRKTLLFNNRWIKVLFPSLSDVNENTEDDEDMVNTSSASRQTATSNGWNVASWTSDEPVVTWQDLDAEQEKANGRINVADDLWTSDVSAFPSPMHPARDDMTSSEDSRSANFTGPPNESYPTWTQDSSIDRELVFSGILNTSQIRAVYDMLDFTRDISIIQGPPGTGKTTVIAAYVAEILNRPVGTCLIVAQSNVAIKNVGEKLYKSGILDWTLVVSSEFLTGWHEHLYEQLPNSNVLASKDMRHPLRSRIVLSTLSMISNSRFIDVTKHMHFESIIVEEASQISMNSYLPAIMQYGKDVKKINFVGDNNQLPPFASEGTEALWSVYENGVLLGRHAVLMLDTQYRMPSTIGNFISKEVYQSQLISWDEHPVSTSLCVQFLDVHGMEEPDRFSFKNSSEAEAAISIATILSQKQKTFKIITPYETQRDHLELQLRSSGLPWANTCFTVDSFQGNEGDYIIISTVRTQAFLQSPEARHTLIGRMAEEWDQVEGGWIQEMDNLAEKLYIA
ncbi:hypothetical protein ACEPAI_6870 [Sanghuangporus weigelae]